MLDVMYPLHVNMIGLIEFVKDLVKYFYIEVALQENHHVILY